MACDIACGGVTFSNRFLCKLCGYDKNRQTHDLVETSFVKKINGLDQPIYFLVEIFIVVVAVKLFVENDVVNLVVESGCLARVYVIRVSHGAYEMKFVVISIAYRAVNI